MKAFTLLLVAGSLIWSAAADETELCGRCANHRFTGSPS